MEPAQTNNGPQTNGSFIPAWTAATVLGYALAVGVLLVAIPLFKQWVPTLLIPVGALTVAVCQGVVIQRYAPGVGWWQWARATLKGLGSTILVLFVISLLVYSFISFRRGGGDYLPYAYTVIIVGALLLMAVGSWIGLVGWIALRQWQVLGVQLRAARPTRNTWILSNIGLQTGAIVLAGMLYYAMTGRPQDVATPQPAILLACAVLGGMITGWTSGMLLARILPQGGQGIIL